MQVRYLVVWNPIIIMATQALLLAMGFTPEPPPEHHDAVGAHHDAVGAHAELGAHAGQ